MGKRKKNRAARPLSTEELLTERVSQILGAEKITPDMIYGLLLLGHRCYRQGDALSHEAVWRSIINGFNDHDRYYLTPGQNAMLHGRESPNEDDFAALMV